MARHSALRAIATLLIYAFVVSIPTSLAGQGPVAIVGATIIDGNGGAPLVNGTIVIKGNRITAIGPVASVDVRCSYNIALNVSIPRFDQLINTTICYRFLILIRTNIDLV